MGQPKLNYRGFPEGNGFFEELPDTTRDIVEHLLLETMEDQCNHELYGVDARAIECRARDGFSPYCNNKGGVNVTGFADLMYMQGSGYYPSAKKSSELIQSIIDNSLQLATERFFEENNELLTKNGFDSVSKVSYHNLLDSEKEEIRDLAEELSEFENEYLSGDENSVLFEIRAMYHGKDERGNHQMTVFASISASDAPYHRNADVLSERLIVWRDESSLEKKLKKALKEVTEEVF